MAVQTQRQLGFKIGDAVKARIQSVIASKQGARLEEERRFQALVSSRDLSLDDQLDFRKQQLLQEERSTIRDEAFVTEIKKDIGSLQAASRADRYRKSYYESYTSWKSGLKPVQDHVKFLEDQLGQTNDPTLAKDIRDALSEARVAAKTAEDSILDNYVEFAKNDKTDVVLSAAIDRVRSAKAKSVLGGDAVRASVLDLKEQSLRQTRAQSLIENDEHKYDLNRIKSTHPTRILDFFDSTAGSADATTPVTIDGRRYLNAQDYWKNRRGDYIANGGFVKDYADYYGAWVDSTVARSPELARDVLGQINDSTRLLLARPEMKGFENQLNDVASQVFKKGIDTLAKKYIQQAEVDYDFATAAKKIDELATATGVDVKPYQNDLIGKLAEVKSPIANAIIQLAADYQTRGYTASAALAAATKQYRSGELLAAPVSPAEIAAKKPEDVAAATGAKNPVPPEAPAPPTPEPKPPEGTSTMTTEKAFIPETSTTTKTETSSTTTTTPLPVQPLSPPVAPKRATLVNNSTKERVAVDIGSKEEKDYFGKGFVLETTPPTQ